MKGNSGSGAMPPSPGPVKISHKKMAADGGHMDFMFLDPASYQAAGSAAERNHRSNCPS